MKNLIIGKTVKGIDFTLPVGITTEAIAVLATRGSGKTYLASVVAEELMKAHQPICIVDPTGGWHGIRSSADGKSAGFPVVVFGGDHADVPLEEGSGDIIARAIVEQRFSAILDLSLLRKGQQIRFMTAFSETLYHLNRQALHLIIDEADAFAPQRIMTRTGEGGGNPARLLGAIEDIVRRGRIRGIGCTLITQRPAVLNKDVLTQCGMLVCLRMGHPNDLKPINEWVEQHGTPEEAREIIKSLPSLPIGTAWFWSPGAGLRERVAVRRRETFDSSATPKAGETMRVPKKLAVIDVEKLGKDILATVERAKENNPVELKRRIADQDKLIASLRKASPEVAEIEKEVQVFRDGEVKNLTDWAELTIEAAKDVILNLSGISDKLSAALQKTRIVPPIYKGPARPTVAYFPKPKPGTDFAGLGQENGITQPQQRILNAIRSMERLGIVDMDKSNAAVFSDQSPTSSGYNNNLGRLRSAGLIHYPQPGRVGLTPEGRNVAQDGSEILSRADLHTAWFSKLSAPKAAILKALIVTHPDSLSKDELAEASSQSQTSSGYSNNLGNLRSLGLIDYPHPGRVVATSLLFPESLS